MLCSAIKVISDLFFNFSPQLILSFLLSQFNFAQLSLHFHKLFSRSFNLIQKSHINLEVIPKLLFY